MTQGLYYTPSLQGATLLTRKGMGFATTTMDGSGRADEALTSLWFDLVQQPTLLESWIWDVVERTKIRCSRGMRECPAACDAMDDRRQVLGRGLEAFSASREGAARSGSMRRRPS